MFGTICGVIITIILDFSDAKTDVTKQATSHSFLLREQYYTTFSLNVIN